MNPWSADAAWQNFSSLCQEASAAAEAREEIARFHHLTAALYFGTAALEAFLNQQMRTHMAGQSEAKVFRRIRDGRFLKKLNEWPTEILRKPLAVPSATLEQLELFYGVRGDPTHPKTKDGDVYRRLEAISPRRCSMPSRSFAFASLQLEVRNFRTGFLAGIT
jgi:hypothetical protein